MSSDAISPFRWTGKGAGEPSGKGIGAGFAARRGERESRFAEKEKREVREREN